MLAQTVAPPFGGGPAMPTFRQLIGAHGNLLVVDACSTTVQAGWLAASGSRWESEVAEAGTGLFRCLERLAIDPSSAGAFVFCDGPGSILGVRTTAAAVRAWCTLQSRPVYGFHSLQILAYAAGDPTLTVIADARRDTWHCARIGEAIQRVATAALPGSLAMPDGFRHWTEPPPRAVPLPYCLRDLLPKVAEVDLFRPVEAPDAFLHEEPSYARWTPQIHRAP